MSEDMRRWVSLIAGIGAILLSSSHALAAPSKAEPAADSLAPRIFDRVRAMPKKPMLRQGRLELSVQASLGIGDAYYHVMGGAADLTFYPLDTLGLAISGVLMAKPEPGRNLDLVREGLLAQPADYSPLYAGAFGSMIWVPIEGKLSVMDQSILYFDTFVSLGGGVVWNQEQELIPAAQAGVGQHFVVSDWLNVRLQLRDVVYMDRYVFMGEERDALRNYLMLELGLGLFVPPSS